MNNMPFREPIQRAGNGVNHSISKFYYSKGFPVEAWHYLGDWIKNRFSRSNLSPSNPKDAEEIGAIYSEFMTEVHNTAEISKDPFAKYKLWSAEQKLEGMSPPVFYQILKEGIELERTLTCAAQSGTKVIVYSHMSSTMAAEAVAILANKSLEFRHRTAQLASLLAHFKFRVDDKANYDRVAQEVSSNATASNVDKSGAKKMKHQFTTVIDTLEQQMESMKNQLESCLSEYLTYIRDTVSECYYLVGKVVDKLLPTIRWHCWELNDVVPSMTNVQQWYSQLIDICFDLKESLGTMEQKDIPSNFQSLWYDRITRSSKELTDCHNSLLANPIAVSTQPAEILRKYKQTSMQVSFLCGRRSFGREAKLEMKVILINENQAKKVHQFGFPSGIEKDKRSGNGEVYETSGTLTGNTAALSSTGTWEFERLSIKTVERKKMTNNDSVLDEKYCFLIYNITPLENNKIWWCCSRPFFVTVNNSQNSKVFASVFIDEYFRTRNREPFDVPERVPCSKLIAALEKYFMRMTNCQRGFTPTNIAFLRSKLLKHERDEDPFVDLKRLSENVELFNFTFFNWFTGIIEVVNAHLKTYWENGFIIGFIDPLTTKELLTRVPRDGGFIVRFSESKLSSVILSYSLKMDDDDKSITASLQPLTCDTLKSLSLPEILQGRIYHGQAKRGFTGVYFYELSEGSEVLKWEQKSVAFTPLPNKEKPETPNPVGYVKCNVMLGVTNPEDA